jgi:hypothetical protein
VLSIYTETNKIFTKAVLANTGMWFLYIFPIAIVAVMFKQIGAQLKLLISVPEKDIDDIIPKDHFAAL